MPLLAPTENLQPTQEDKIDRQVSHLIAIPNQVKGQLIAVQGDVERHSKRAGELETQVRDLNAREQDLDKRAAAKAAQIAAEMGTQVPAKITPAGDKAPTTAAEVWNRQFTKA